MAVFRTGKSPTTSYVSFLFSVERGAVVKPGRVVFGVCFLVAVFVVALLGGFIGRRMGVSQYTISYADFISIMLTAVSLLVTLLGFILAIFAFIGWNSISSKVGSDVRSYLDEGFKDGNTLHSMLVDQIKAEAPVIMYEGVSQVDIDFADDAAAEGAEGV